MLFCHNDNIVLYFAQELAWAAGLPERDGGCVLAPVGNKALRSEAIGPFSGCRPARPPMPGSMALRQKQRREAASYSLSILTSAGRADEELWLVPLRAGAR